jgi:hypothetical protein
MKLKRSKMKYDLIEVLKRIVATPELIDIYVLIPIIHDEGWGYYNEKLHIVEFLMPDLEGNPYPSQSYEDFFYSHFNFLARMEKKSWIEIENVIDNPKLLEKINKRRSMIIAFLEIIKSKKTKPVKNKQEINNISKFMVEMLEDLLDFYVGLIKACNDQLNPSKTEKVKLNLSVRELATVILLLDDENIIEIPKRKRSMVIRVFTKAFLTKGSDAQNSFGALNNMFDKYNLSDKADINFLRDLQIKLGNTQQKLKIILNKSGIKSDS